MEILEKVAKVHKIHEYIYIYCKTSKIRKYSKNILEYT